MSKENGEVTCWPCYRERGAEFIGEGADSAVYKVGDLVVKNYRVYESHMWRSPLNENRLMDYFTLTNEASDYVKKQGISLYLPFSKKHVPLEVNPFLAMHNCDVCGGIEGIAKYIPGITILEARSIFDMIDVKTALSDLSIELGRKLKYTGVDIVTKNIKLSENGSLIITDLCADILFLRKKLI